MIQHRSTPKHPAVVDEFTLDGKKVVVENADLPLDEVKLDMSNPRIANTLLIQGPKKGKGSEDERLADLLWEDPAVHDLYRQVLINKGLIERIIVRTDGTVVEGNCRTVVYRKLHEKHPQDQKWQRIPARVLPENITAKDVAILLGGLHVANKITWSSFEKAGHVYRLHKDFALTQDEIAQRLRMSKSKINQLIRAFDAMKNKFLPKYPSPTNIYKFSHFEELYKNPVLREWAMDSEDAVKSFADWVGTNRLDQAVQVRQLPEVLSNAEALKALNKEGFAAAKKVLEEHNPALTSPLFRQMMQMTEALEEARLDDIQKAKKGSGAGVRRVVLNLKDSLDRFIELAGIETK